MLGEPTTEKTLTRGTRLGSTVRTVAAWPVQQEHSPWFTPLCGLLALCCLLSPLGFHLYKYSPDVFFNYWFTRFYADSLLQGVLFPSIINVPDESCLNPLTLFYGSMLHQPAGLLATAVSLRLSLWLYLFAATWMQYSMTAYTFGVATRSKLLGNMVAGTVLCSVYATNNLYARGALAEYLATAMAVTCTCALLALCVQPERKRELLLVAAMTFGIICNSHALTMTFMTAFLGWLGLWAVGVFVVKHRQKGDAKFLAVVTSLVLLCVAHFGYAVLMNPKTYISMYSGCVQFPHLDNLILRFLPLCFGFFGDYGDKLNILMIMCNQINVAMLLLAGVYIVCNHRHKGLKNWALALAVCCVAMALFVTWLSVKPATVPLLFPLVSLGQFGYRLITYVNIYALMAVFFALLALRNQHINVLIPAARKCLWLAMACVLIYLVQLGATYEWRKEQMKIPLLKPAELHLIKDASRLRGMMYGYRDYATPEVFTIDKTAPESKTVHLTVSAQDNWLLHSEPFAVTNGEVLRFDILPFNWNHLYAVNTETGVREEIPRTQLSTVTDSDQFVLYAKNITAGTYRFEARFEPPVIWRVLRAIYPVSMGLLVLGGLWAAARLWRRSTLKMATSASQIT